MRSDCAFRHSILVVRNADSGTGTLIRGLEGQGFTAARVRSVSEALVELETAVFPLILFDLADGVDAGPSSTLRDTQGGGRRDCAHPNSNGNAPALPGITAIRQIAGISPASQIVVMVTREVGLTACCQAVVCGAASFVEWIPGQPVEPVAERLRQAYQRYEVAVAQSRDLASRSIFEETGIAGKSQIMAKVLFLAKQAALVSDAPVLICGESGTGKQLLSEAIHRMDPKRRERPFITVNCAAITGTLAESALFGHRKGSFTGATSDRPGYFRAAQGGTVLLDEISELDSPLQPKLLRVLQEGRVLPVGEDREHEVDVRVIAASNRPLPVLVQKGEFRLDLYQRLNVITLQVPSLRERPEDVPLLVDFFLSRYASYYVHPITSVDERVYDVLGRSIGSGNIRELENAVRQILAFKTAGSRIELSDIPAGLLQRQGESVLENDVTTALTSAIDVMLQRGDLSLGEMLDEFEGMVLREALARSRTSQTHLAQRLGLTRRTFYNKLRKHDLPTIR